MLKALFSSSIRIKVMSHFLKNPSRSFYLRELERLLKKSVTPLKRELNRLEQIGFLETRWQGNQKHYLLNLKFPLLEDLKGIFEKAECCYS